MQKLIIEARVNPTDITHVKEGQDALVRLSALNQRLTPMIEAKVIYLSADIVSDQSARKVGEPDPARRDSFIVRVRLDGSGRVRLAGQAVTVLRGELTADKMAS